ncbi:hypothetical protein H696_04041 [Fonticula alba]|uniref:Uncharacterized protein n=1 Tax=Fonticula alba TaxID=691883 RepID=A0A058Z7X2_FONAL|nr:hypothetical protein H696_04041 [Fonticula alba]KCV69622.1 hypothetical protein H696_04041 [Fonticula alba]|eukprot:XP_009496187.1 hypothetical protein H696_04041 [Fonticula alba]
MASPVPTPPSPAAPSPAVVSFLKPRTKRALDMFIGSPDDLFEDSSSQRLRMTSKILDEYEVVRRLPESIKRPTRRDRSEAKKNAAEAGTAEASGLAAAIDASVAGATGRAEQSGRPSGSQSLVLRSGGPGSGGDRQLAALGPGARAPAPPSESGSLVLQTHTHSVPRPTWHAPWKLMRVISGHSGWVRSISVDPTNQWFATGSRDQTIKIWDLASGTLKTTFTAHSMGVRAVAASQRHPYLFSAGEDKQVLCWDLEINKVIRKYHGHLNGVYCMAVHPSLDVLITGSRDASVRVWDIRAKQCVHTLTGHMETVASVAAQSVNPQIVSGSMDSTVRLWDLAAGKCLKTLTNHKKSVRSVLLHPSEYTFASGSSDHIKQWQFPNGTFLQNLPLTDHPIVNTMSINQDNVLFAGADNGMMHFYDWKSGYNFQTARTVPQPGSLASECGILSSTFDHTGTRLITCEVDKSIKVWCEDAEATPESHPIAFKAMLKRKRY